jgi:hypothetical protein
MKLAQESSLPQYRLSPSIREEIRAKAALRKELELFVLSDSDDDETESSRGMWLDSTDESSDRTCEEEEEEDHVVETPLQRPLISSTHHAVCWNDEDDDDDSSVGSFFSDTGDDEAIETVASSGRLDRVDSPSQRCVRFSSVTIREYAVTVGDHPVTGDACPLSLDWAHSEVDEVRDLTSYEYSRYFLRDMPRRLSLPERRVRVREVNDLSPEEVDRMETAFKLRQVNESILDVAPYLLQAHHVKSC